MAGLDPAITRRPIARVAYAFVYLMANHRRGTLYVGVTGDLVRRVHEHRAGTTAGYTARYALKRLVWHEPHDGLEAAIRREKAIKRWSRQWKVELIERTNPDWRDLWDEITA